MVFPDASDKALGSCITQVPTVELTGSISITDMFHEPLGFLSRSSRVWRSNGELWTRRVSRS